MSDSKHKIFNPTDCIPEQTMFDYIDNKLTAKERHTVEKHLLDCELCSDALEGLELAKDRGRIGTINQKIKERIAPSSSKKVIAIHYSTIVAVAASLVLLIGSVFYFDRFTSNQLMEEKGVAEVAAPSEIPPPEAAEALTDSTAETIRLETQKEPPPLAYTPEQKPSTTAFPPALNETELNIPPSAAGTSAPEQSMYDMKEPVATVELNKIPDALKKEDKDESDKEKYAAPSAAPFKSAETVTSKVKKEKSENDNKRYRKANRTSPPPAAYDSNDLKSIADDGAGSGTAPYFLNNSTINDSIYIVAEEMPEFPGGTTEMLKFINANLKYPKEYTEGSVSGTVYAQFIVNTNGQLIQPKIIKGLDCCPEFDTEVIRVIKIMPQWKPGKQDGKVISVQYNLPVKFGFK